MTSIRHEDIGGKPKRYHLETKTVDSESKSDLDVVSETLEVMEEFAGVVYQDCGFGQ